MRFPLASLSINRAYEDIALNALGQTGGAESLFKR
jgi:hypothetical protein